MKILLDHCVDSRFRHHLGNHFVYTTKYMSWDNLANGALLQAAEADGFDILLTTDKNLRYQQNMGGRRIAVVVFDTVLSQLPELVALVPDFDTATSTFLPGSVYVVESKKPS